MILDFIFSNLSVIILSIWIVFLFFVALRFFRPNALKNISFSKLIIAAMSINVFYAAFITWGQYHVWATATDFTKMFVNLPLSAETPMPYLLEWMRPLFENNFGFFLYYVLGRVWLYVFILFLISAALYFVLKIWKSNYGGFSDYGPELIFILMLICGWPGALILIPLGFIISTLLLVILFFSKGNKVMEIEPSFIVASLIVLLFGKIILNFL